MRGPQTDFLSSPQENGGVPLDVRLCRLEECQEGFAGKTRLVDDRKRGGIARFREQGGLHVFEDAKPLGIGVESQALKKCGRALTRFWQVGHTSS